MHGRSTRTEWAFPDLRDPVLDARLGDRVAVGADLDPATLLDAYALGLFPMPGGSRRRPELHWWSPVQRGVLPLDGLVVSRSLRQARRRFEVRVDTAFDQVLAGCADPRRPDGWISAVVAEAYTALHRLGHAHSVEAWQDGELAGGLYGVSIGGLFAGESMFHRARDASKVALVALVEHLRAAPSPELRLLDTQWATPHLQTLGVVEVPRATYLRRLDRALDLPAPTW